MKSMKKISIFIISFLLIILITNIVYAFGVEDLTGTPVKDDGVKSFGNIMITVLTTIGSILSVVVLIIIGIKYMIGSVEERASYKKSLMPYVIGCILIFSASTIASIIFGVITK